jgi:predicted nucleotidyltransferase
MEKMTQNNNKEILVRKKITNFVEKIFKSYAYHFDHDRFKKVCYGEDCFRSLDEEKFKNYYDAYNYLLINNKNQLTNSLLNKFFFLIFGKQMDESLLLRIASNFFNYMDKPPLESAISFHLEVYQELDFQEEEKTIISLMFFNYVLTKNNIPSIVIFPHEFDEYLRSRKQYLSGKKDALNTFFLNLMQNASTQDITYYQNLQPLNLKDLYQQLIDDQEMLHQEYHIKKLYIFGSFGNGIARIDSDIDLLIAFSLDLTRDELNNLINSFKNHYFFIFHRYLDIIEIGNYFNDDFLTTIRYAKRVF